MSAAQTRQNTERMKLTPMSRAIAMASQAANNSNTPTAQRSNAGTAGHACGPARSTRVPPSTQSANAVHQTQRGGASPQPPQSASAQPAATAAPTHSDAPPP